MALPASLLLALLAGATPAFAQKLELDLDADRSGRPAWAPERPGRLELPPESRQFDFWVGGWDVNLRIQQPDLSWKDSVKAEARIYPILFGKAVLELWDSPHIKGYSLRYYDTKRKEWVLWLNWPGQDRSGSSSLSGSFRHGRGDFQSVSERADGTKSISRYSFNDITPNSLRWDDAYSEDGGKTWRNQWIMEFTRKEAVPTLDPAGGRAHTYVDGSRATLPQFAHSSFLKGRREGIRCSINDKVPLPHPVSWVGYQVLDGSALIGFLRYSDGGHDREVFYHLTWNTYAQRFEATVLDDHPDTPAVVSYSAAEADSFVALAPPQPDGSQLRFTFREGEGGQAHLTIESRRDATEPWELDEVVLLFANGATTSR